MNAKNAFEKEFFKLMNNSVYGSSIQYRVTRTVSLIGLFSEFWRDLGIFPEFGKPVWTGFGLFEVFGLNRLWTVL